MNISEYIKAVFNEMMQNFNVRDYVKDFSDSLTRYGEYYGFNGNLESFITDFNAEINGVRKALIYDINNYVDELEKINKDSNHYDKLFEEWYENITLSKTISKKINIIYEKYMEIAKNQNDDFRLRLKEIMDVSFTHLEEKVKSSENKVKAEIAMLKGRKLAYDKANDNLFNSVEYMVDKDEFRVLDKQEFYLDINSTDNSYEFNNRYFNKIFCKKYNDDFLFTLETDIGVKQILMINDVGFAYIDNEKNVRVIFDYETVNFVTSSSNVVYNVNDEEKMKIIFKLLEQIDMNLVHLVKNKLSIKKCSELSENEKKFH